MRKTIASLLLATLMPVSAFAIVGDAKEPGVPESQLQSLRVNMCTPSLSKCEQLPVTESTSLYHQYSLDTCKVMGKGISIMKANEWLQSERDGLVLQVLCFDKDYRVSYRKVYTWPDLGVGM